jgi:hypothetical protein
MKQEMALMLALWFALSIVLGIFVGKFIQFGMSDTRDTKRQVSFARRKRSSGVVSVPRGWRVQIVAKRRHWQ